MSRFRPLLGLTAALAGLVLLVGDLQARPSSGGSFGSRGSRTFSAPPSTTTAPRGAAPLERTITQPTRPGAVAGAPARAPQTGGFFNRPGLMGGLLAGFLGAGLFGMLFGNGLLGGLGGLASMFGLILQIGLVVIVAMLAWKWWQRRNAPATAGGPALRDMGDYSGSGNQSYGGAPQQSRGGFLGGLGGGLGGLGMGGAAAPAPAVESNVELEKADFDEFERLLSEVSVAYANEDYTKLRTLATPEMLSYFSEELAKNSSRGLANQVSDINLLQGDLAESWREGDTDYATVAMRYQIRDVTVDRATGKVVEGSPEPQEVTEVWTFRRERGGNWVLSAIQQA
jgi:predicted lipid-binding transport protein (Tim44 family)